MRSNDLKLIRKMKIMNKLHVGHYGMKNLEQGMAKIARKNHERKNKMAAICSIFVVTHSVVRLVTIFRSDAQLTAKN